ncbi:MAG: glucosidase, partial [Bacteroidota bacterium]
LIESLQTFDNYYGDDFTIEHAGEQLTLRQVSHVLAKRLVDLFLRDESGKRPAFGSEPLYQTDPHFKDHVLFYEYFHGDTGAGLGASHQTGWTALVAMLIDQCG